MKAFEFKAKVTPEGRLIIPEALASQLAQQPVVRIIVLIGESPKMYEEGEQAWSHLTTEQFFNGYSDADAIYDQSVEQ